MSKNKLSKGQQRRVKANHQRRLKTTAEKADYDDNLFGETSEGIVISRWSPATAWSGGRVKTPPTA